MIIDSAFNLTLNTLNLQRLTRDTKIEKILKGSLDSITFTFSENSNYGQKICLGCKGKTLLGVVNKVLRTKSLFTLITSSKLSRK